MAGDWIPVRVDLDEDPAVIAVTASVDDLVDEQHAVGKLVRLWSWFDQQTTDGHAAGVTETWIDRYVGVTGFAAAMQRVGWLVPAEGGGLQMPGFDRWNGQSGKKRLNASKRKQKQRSAHNSHAPRVTFPSHASHVERDNGHAGRVTKTGPQDNTGQDRTIQQQPILAAAEEPVIAELSRHGIVSPTREQLVAEVPGLTVAIVRQIAQMVRGAQNPSGLLVARIRGEGPAAVAQAMANQQRVAIDRKDEDEAKAQRDQNRESLTSMADELSDAELACWVEQVLEDTSINPFTRERWRRADPRKNLLLLHEVRKRMRASAVVPVEAE